MVLKHFGENGDHKAQLEGLREQRTLSVGVRTRTRDRPLPRWRGNRAEKSAQEAPAGRQLGGCALTDTLMSGGGGHTRPSGKTVGLSLWQVLTLPAPVARVSHGRKKP